MHLYVAYRAQVRAKVTALRAAQEPDHRSEDAARQLLGLCIDHLRRATPRLVLVGGAPGTGKSTVAADLHDSFGWKVVRSDAERKAQTDAAVGTSDRWKEGLYSPASTAHTYGVLMDAARVALVHGESIVLDASFTDGSQRAAARDVAEQTSAEVLELRCTLEPHERDRRIARRQRRDDDVSDANEEIAARLAAEADPWPEATVLPTDESPSVVAEKAVEVVRELDPWMSLPAIVAVVVGGIVLAALACWVVVAASLRRARSTPGSPRAR